MKMIRMRKVTSSANDANVEYYINPDRIKSIIVGATTTEVNFIAIDGLANDVGDNIRITHTSGQGMYIAEDILLHGMSNKSKGGVALTVDADSHNSHISALSLVGVA